MVATRKSSKPPPPPEPYRKSTRSRKPVRELYLETAVSPQTQKPRRIVQCTQRNKKPKAVQCTQRNKKPKASSATFVSSRRTQQKERRSGNPKSLVNPETEEQVWIQSATLQDLKLAQKKRRPPWPLSRRYLVTVPSPQQRQNVYVMAARALQELEERVLPTYGGRHWRCNVTIQDVAVASTGKVVSPYFVWHRKGHLELAAWPHIVEKMPNPPRFPGYSVHQNKPKPKQPTTTKSKSIVEEQLIDQDEADNEITVEEEEENQEEELSPELMALHQLQEREASGLSELAWNERWRVPLPTIQYKWISPCRKTFKSRSSAWEHAVALCRQEVLLDKVLLGYGANGKELKLSAPSRKVVMEVGSMRFERDGLWVIGQEETWGLERLKAMNEKDTADAIEKRESKSQSAETAAIKPFNTKKKLTGLTYYVQCNRDEYRHLRLKEVRSRTATGPVITDATSSNSNVSHKTVSHSLTNKNTSPVATITSPSAGEERTRDEESFVISNSMSAHQPQSTKPSALSFTLNDADRELKLNFRALSTDEQQTWIASAKQKQSEIDKDEAISFPVISNNVDKILSPAENNEESNITVVVDIDDGVSSLGESHCIVPSTNQLTRLPNDYGSVVSSSPTPHLSTAALVQTQRKAMGCIREGNFSKILSNFSRSQKWCMSQDQIKMCYDAGMEHYDQVMRTVTARDLTRELQDGFDLLRERCRGRFDMELPTFDGPDFGFLTDTKLAPWMPIVREILGAEVVLIHKGMFLSLPGSEKQNYHQDGPHLTTQYQKPCHAINVFVPLVDLNLENGPTEFCLGSHILGHEELDEKHIEIPTVKAGTPVIFDYRLGHRGLANNSSICRPIVYCTYAAAADGKEFRDSVNFSRKRYHRIGDLVERGLTREERVLKRKRAIEDKLEQEAIEMVSNHLTTSCVDPKSIEHVSKYS